MKKLLVLLMAALMVVAMAVAGCGGDDKKADGNGAAHKEKLVIGTDADINNLNLQKQQEIFQKMRKTPCFLAEE